MMFQSTAGPKTGCTESSVPCVIHVGGFQSTAGPKTGCTEDCLPERGVFRVSIHSRPEDRLHRWDRHRACVADGVSIHSRPEDRLHHYRRLADVIVTLVSIHSRPEDRLHRGVLADRIGVSRRFNPQPARRPAAPGARLGKGGQLITFQSTAGPKTGCTKTSSRRRLRWTCFNPQPARRPAAPSLEDGVPDLVIQFQSTAGPKTGCTVATSKSTPPRTVFQSTAGPKTGCTADFGHWFFGATGFQSTAGPKTGCTGQGLVLEAGQQAFQSTAGPKTGCTAQRLEFGALQGRVSIHSRPEDRLHRASTPHSRRSPGRFNPQPARRPAAPACACTCSTAPKRFQSTAGPKTGCTVSHARIVAPLDEFQSTAGPKTGCTPPGRRLARATATRFNPQPARRPAAPIGPHRAPIVLAVSIHSRPEDRLHRGRISHLRLTPSSFNPQPARRPAAPVGRPSRRASPGCFNPQPARRPAAPMSPP